MQALQDRKAAATGASWTQPGNQTPGPWDPGHARSEERVFLEERSWGAWRWAQIWAECGLV